MGRGLIDTHLRALVDAGGSDLHLKVGVPPRIRVNGILDPIADAPVVTEEDTEAVAAAIVRPHLVDRFARGEEVDFAYTVAGVGRFRVNAYLQRDTVAMVFRQVVSQPRSIPQLNLPDRVRQFAELERGLVLVAGPTGSGKTTTLAAMVDHINRTRKAHVVTIEDPIEVMHDDVVATISQREVGADTPSFAAAMRAALRQDPDVVLVGEMRDRETVATAMTAAETGHLVLSTLHTTDATETISRIIEFFPEHEQRQARLVLAGVLKGTVCQRLVPTVAGDRVPATEVMVVNGRVQSWILKPEARETVQEIIADGEYYGMHTFDQAIMGLYGAGLIDLRAALAAASNAHDLSVMLRRQGLLRDGRRAASVDPDDELAALVEQLASHLGDDSEAGAAQELAGSSPAGADVQQATAVALEANDITAPPEIAARRPGRRSARRPRR